MDRKITMRWTARNVDRMDKLFHLYHKMGGFFVVRRGKMATKNGYITVSGNYITYHFTESNRLREELIQQAKR